MAQIVCVDTGTKRDNNEIGDIVSMYEDDVLLSGAGYANVNVIQIKGVTLTELKTAIELKKPETQVAFQSKVTTWSFDRPTEKEVWKDDKGSWNFLENRPKYALSATDIIGAQDTTDLNSDVVTKDQKLILLDKVKDKIALDATNLTAVTDLNV